MFGIFRKNRIAKYISNASEYLEKKYIPEEQQEPLQNLKKQQSVTRLLTDTETGKSIPDSRADVNSPKRNLSADNEIRFRIKSPYEEDRGGNKNDTSSTSGDKYNLNTVSGILKKHDLFQSSPLVLEELDNTMDKTFVDILIVYIRDRELRDSEVYKAAQIDRRLFSKIMSDRLYKPSKDTVIAIAIALKLSLDEANDLLSRAGYTFSHSSRRDVIIEYFFNEQIYKLDDINQVLYNFGLKIIGR